MHLHGIVLTSHFSPLSSSAIHRCINVVHVVVCVSNLLAFTVSTLIQEAQQTRWGMHGASSIERRKGRNMSKILREEIRTQNL